MVESRYLSSWISPDRRETAKVCDDDDIDFDDNVDDDDDDDVDDEADDDVMIIIMMMMVMMLYSMSMLSTYLSIYFIFQPIHLSRGSIIVYESTMLLAAYLSCHRHAGCILSLY